MRVSQVELYNEELKDLLSPDDDLRKLKIFDDPMHKGCVIQNVEEVLVTNAADVIRIMQTGSIKRRIAVTQLNHNSRCVRLPKGRVDHDLCLLWLTYRHDLGVPHCPWLSVCPGRGHSRSSRSHCVSSITVHLKESTPDGEELMKVRASALTDDGLPFQPPLQASPSGPLS